MFTSYFALSGGHPKAVAISAKSPPWYIGKHYKKLAPTYDIFQEYKRTEDKERYTERYYNEILSNLDPKKVFEEIGRDSVLLCYETREKFCHRHIVSRWFFDSLGEEVAEI